MTAARRAKTRLGKAATELAVAQSGIERQLAPWRSAFDRHRTAWILAGGFAGGMALAGLPPRIWARIGAAAGSGMALVARTFVTPMIAGALLTRRRPGRASAAALADRQCACAD